MKFKSLQEQHLDLFLQRLTISKDDLTETEKKIIDISFDLMREKLDDIKILEDENKRITIENLNLRSSMDDRGYHSTRGDYHDDEFDY